ncbi:C2H2-type domain-containing protein [Abeliophyllum distichum]|uniref:C2H2-type domain-containing protein n=1 Tax=Abeliophyllum distichum TaxID=126358 RepID=A0ABD1Q0K7_9LAMI
MSSNLNNRYRRIQQFENLMERQCLETLIACSVCYQIFFDCTSLMRHYLSHVPENGTSQQRFQNDTNFCSNSSRSTRYSSVPFSSGASDCLVPCALRNASPWPLPNSLQFGRETLIPRPLQYPSPSNFNSAISHATFVSQADGPSDLNPSFASQPSRLPYVLPPISPGTLVSQTAQPSNICSPTSPYASASQSAQNPNFCSRFASQPFGLLQFLSPVNPGMFSAQPAQLSNFHSGISPCASASASQPTQISNFHSPIRTSTIASQSFLGTRNLGLGPRTKPLKNSGRQSVSRTIRGHTFSNLGQHIDKRIMVNHVNEGGDNFNPNELDLTLKL